MKRALTWLLPRIEYAVVVVCFVTFYAVMAVLEHRNENRDPFDVEERYE